MAISKLSKSSMSSGTKNSAAWDGNVAFGQYWGLQSIEVGSTPVSQITFNNIPQTYEHLQLIVTARSTGPYDYSTVYLQPNQDSSINYTFHYIQGSPTGGGAALSAVNGGRATGNDTSFLPQLISGALSTGNAVGGIEVKLLDYTSNKYKMMLSVGGNDNRGFGSPNGTVAINSGLWLSKSPITRLDVFTDGSFAPYSRLSLYGIK